MQGKYFPDPLLAAHRSRVRTHARAALFFGSNWMTVLLVLFSVMLLFYGIGYFTRILILLLSECIPAVSFGTLAVSASLVLYLILSPLIPGVLSFCYDLFRVSRGELSGRVPITVIFHCYADASSVIRAWVHVTFQLVLFCLPVGVIYLLFRTTAFLTSWNRSIPIPFAYIFITLTAVVFLLGAVYIAGSLSPVLFLSVAHPEMKLKTCIYASFLYMRNHSTEAICAILKFCAAAFLSLFAVGIPFFFYILPYTIFFYISFSQELSNTIS
ncbi:MAG: hypothetical protein ACI3XM_07265 [Eubacteriales bacterium]